MLRLYGLANIMHVIAVKFIACCGSLSLSLSSIPPFPLFPFTLLFSLISVVVASTRIFFPDIKEREKENIFSEVESLFLHGEKMDEKVIEASSPDTLIEAKLSKIPKAFSIENLIAKKSSRSEIVESKFSAANYQHRIPPIAFPQNFPFYNPWAANYLMSNANLPSQNLLLNSQQLYQLQSDKLGNFDGTQQQQPQQQGAKEKISEMLFNPLALSNNPHEQQSTYQQLLHSNNHHNPDQAHFFTSKLKDATFLNEFYTNYFMLENSRIMNLTINSSNNNNNNNENCDGNGSGDNNNSSGSVKRTKNCLLVVNNNNDNSNTNSDYDSNVNSLADNHKMMVMMEKGGGGVYYEDESSYSDLSVTMSPEQLANRDQDKGERGKILNIL
jgi:hypothetical protein